MSECTPFRIDTPQSILDDIREKVGAFPWHQMPEDGGWQYGTDLDYMRELAAYRVAEFDWRAQEAAISQLPQFKVKIDGIDIHFIHEIGSGPSPPAWKLQRSMLPR